MLIKSITVENFLPFQNKQLIEFSTDPVRNVTLIMGDNGAGKTSLAQAFEWCLYGRAPKETNQVINAYVRDRISAGASRLVSVEIHLIKDGVSYIIRREQTYRRKDDGKMDKASPHVFTIGYKDEGELKHVPAADQRATINKLLSSELSHYFFFDGEHVKSMRSEIESGKSSDFADAVKTILGLQPIAAALDHLKAPGTKNSVQRSLMRQRDTAGDQNLEKKKARIETLEKSLPGLEENLEDARAEHKVAEASVKKWSDLLAENEASEKAVQAVERAKRQRDGAISNKRKALDDYFRTFRVGHFRLFAERPIKDARKELADEEKISKGVPSVNDKTIKFILERHRCICGTEFEDFDEVDSALRELLNYVPPKDLGTYISEFDKECRVRTESPLTLPDDLSEKYAALREADRAVEVAEAAVKSAEDYLNSINQVDVAMLRSNLRTARVDEQNAHDAVRRAEGRIRSAKNEIEQLNGEIEAYSVKNEKNKHIDACLAYVNFIYDYLNNYYSAKEAETRAVLAEVVNRFFSTMYDGELHLELDENYGVTVVVDDIDTSSETWKTSSGQTLAIILAFILGILDIAKSNIEKGDQLLHGDTYPLVMDAPLSDFDKTRIGTICSLLPNVAEQVIIIIKDTDGELAEEHLASKIGKRYTIGRVKDYDSIVKE